MSKRILSLACCLALLLGCLAGLGFTAAAASTGYTAGTIGQYKGLGKNAALDVELGGKQSLIKGMIPYSKADLSALWSDSNCNGGKANESTLIALTDGKSGSSNALDRMVIAASSATFYFDLGYVADLTDFVISGSQCDSVTRSATYDSTIYVGNDASTLVSDANIVWKNAFEGNNGYYTIHIQPTDGATVTGRYVAFTIKIPSPEPVQWYGQIRIGELAVYGKSNADTGFVVNQVTSQADMPAKTALNAGLGIYRWDFMSGVSISGGNPNPSANVNKYQVPNNNSNYNGTAYPSVVTDGVVTFDRGEFKTTTSATNAKGTANIPIPYEEGKYWEAYNTSNKALTTNADAVWRSWSTSDDAKWLFFDLGSSLEIDQILLGAHRSLPEMTSSSAPASEAALKSKYYYNASGGHQLKNIAVYVSDDVNSLFGKVSVQNDGTGNAGVVGDDSKTTKVCQVGMSTRAAGLVTLNEAVYGRYVGIYLDASSAGATISELAVYGDEGEDVTSQTGNPIFLSSTDDADLIPPAESNLLYGKVTPNSGTVAQPATFKRYDLDTGALSTMYMQNAGALVDGEINRINATTTNNVATTMATKKYVNLDSLGSLSYAVLGAMVVDLGEAKNINKVLVGYANDSAVRLRQWFGKVYVGNDVKTLISEENMIGSWSYVKDGKLPSTINDHGVLFDFEPTQAQYVAFVMPINQLGWSGDAGMSVRFQELGVYEVTEDAFTIEGGQIRTNATALPKGNGQVALRLANTLKVNGVVLDGHVGDYSNATIKIGSATYPVVEVGTLVGRKSLITKENMTPEEGLTYAGIEAVNGKAVPAKNVYSQSEDGEFITFTAVVANVPYYMYAEDICARAYVRYKTGAGDEKTMYGDVMTRNVYDVWANTDDASREVLDRADYLQAGSGYFAKGSRVVFLGDSITNNGAFISEIFKYYAAKYPQDKVEMYMAGVKGGTALGGLTYLDEQVLALNADYVSIMFGMNDIDRDGYRTGYDNASAATKAKIDEHAANMEAIVKKLQAKGIKVILCTPSPYDDTTTGTTTTNLVGCAEALRLCGEKAKALAAKYGCDVIDFNTTMMAATAYVQDSANGGNSDYTIIGRDRVHPDTLGHDLMARIFLNTIGEDVTVPSNAYLLSCLKGEATINSKFQDLGSEFSAKAAAIKTDCITGSVNRKVCSYFEGEFFFIGTENYNTMPMAEKIAKIAALNGSYSGDWRGTECIPNFETNAKNLGANRYAVQQAAKAIYN